MENSGIGSSDTDVEEDPFYPYDTTLDMLDQYYDPTFMADVTAAGWKGEIELKLYKSCKYWKIEVPSWLKKRVSEGMNAASVK